MSSAWVSVEVAGSTRFTTSGEEFSHPATDTPKRQANGASVTSSDVRRFIGHRPSGVVPARALGYSPTRSRGIHLLFKN